MTIDLKERAMEREETTPEEVVHRIKEGVFYEDYDWAAGPALRALDALIAKAERVDALERALAPFAAIGTGEVFEYFAARARMNLTICNPEGRRLCFVNAECFEAARNALSPKESE